MSTTITYIWGPDGSGATMLARRFAAERSKEETAIVERNGETLEDLRARHRVAHLYVTSLEPPRSPRERFLIATEIRLLGASA